MVPEKGLEPSRLTAQGPKPCVSAISPLRPNLYWCNYNLRVFAKSQIPTNTLFRKWPKRNIYPIAIGFLRQFRR